MTAPPAGGAPPLHLPHDFESAGRQVLAYLHRRLGFGLWMLTRTEGEDWIVLQTEDHGYGVAEGTVFRWADSFCSRMVRGEGPRVAPDSSFVPAYLDAPIASQVDIGAYIGVPIHAADGALFGTLCAIDPAPQDEALVDSQGPGRVAGRPARHGADPGTARRGSPAACRAAGGRGAHRRADRPVQPPCLGPPARPRGGTLPPLRPPGCGGDGRPRRAQARQRPAGPCRRRCADRRRGAGPAAFGA